MKLIHLSDLHLGKRVNGFSMLEDQRYILNKILQIIDSEQPDGVIIAGDVYDKSIPSAEAVSLFDDFLVHLSKTEHRVFIISGNHDSPERLAFGNRIMDGSGIHLSPVYDGAITAFKMEDAYGIVNVYMLPFIKPVHVRSAFPDAEISTYSEAVAYAVAQMPMDPAERNILITHQFVTGAVRSESEELSVGGADNVDASVFENFDYVALGHLHGPQNIHSQRIRYCGTPLKYSFSEIKHHKSVTVVELKAKGDLSVQTVPLVPQRDMTEIKGTYNELTLKNFYEGTTLQKDYLHITLTDEHDIPDAISKLRVIYPNLMKLDYDNTRTRASERIVKEFNTESHSPLELFEIFYKQQNGTPLSEDQRAFLTTCIEKCWEGHYETC